MKLLRELKCRINWHKWGEPKEHKGATYVQECEYCHCKQLVIQVIMEGEHGTKVGGDYHYWDVKNRCPATDDHQTLGSNSNA